VEIPSFIRLLWRQSYNTTIISAAQDAPVVLHQPPTPQRRSGTRINVGGKCDLPIRHRVIKLLLFETSLGPCRPAPARNRQQEKHRSAVYETRSEMGVPPGTTMCGGFMLRALVHRKINVRTVQIDRIESNRIHRHLDISRFQRVVDFSKNQIDLSLLEIRLGHGG
jgi:hypothetical protein